jgi:hypothetical protein
LPFLFRINKKRKYEIGKKYTEEKADMGKNRTQENQL